MSDRRGQAADLTTENFRLDQTSVSGAFADSLSDTSAHFEAWLAELKPVRESQKDLAPQGSVFEAAPPGEFRFEGILRVDGYARGLFHSLTGTLILSEAAELESDIVVAAAIIDGCLRGDIHATERVELLSHARVIGNIESPAVAIQPGAVFEGECHFLPAPCKSDSGSESRESRVMEPV
jgi:cytoskeletal protein CcmA (bactofilin family)